MPGPCEREGGRGLGWMGGERMGAGERGGGHRWPVRLLLLECECFWILW